jgi:hypothetical protein
LAASPVGRRAAEANGRGEGKMFDSLLSTKFYNKRYREIVFAVRFSGSLAAL